MKSDEDFLKLINDMRNAPPNSWWDMLRASEDIAKIKNEFIITTLIKLLNDENDRVHRLAILTLGKIGDKRAIDPIIKHLDNPEFIGVAADALRDIGDVKAVPFLINAYRRSNDDVILSALAYLKDIRARDLFFEALSGSRLSHIAVFGLSHFKDDETVKGIITVFLNSDLPLEVRSNALEALGAIGTIPAQDFLIKVLIETEEYDFAKCSIKSLKNCGNQRSIDAIVEVLLHHINPKVRKSAADILGDVKNPYTVEPLITALNDENNDVRWYSIDALGKIKDPKTVDVLLPLLNDPDNNIKYHAMSALANIGDKRASKPITELLKDKNYQTRIWAIGNLAILDGPTAVKPIEECLNDENKEVRSKAQFMLHRIEAWEEERRRGLR